MAPHEEDETAAHLNNEAGLSGGAQPDTNGFFGSEANHNQYGGAFLPPPLVPVMKELMSNTIKSNTILNSYQSLPIYVNITLAVHRLYTNVRIYRTSLAVRPSI